MNNKGFTLIEIIAVLLIISVLGGIAITKYHSLNVGDSMATQVVVELNVRERITWSNTKLGSGAEDIDAAVFGTMNFDVGTIWSAGPTRNGGTVVVDSKSFRLSRKQSTQVEPAYWERVK